MLNKSNGIAFYIFGRVIKAAAVFPNKKTAIAFYMKSFAVRCFEVNFKPKRFSYFHCVCVG